MAFERGGRIDDEPQRWLARRHGTLWCATEVRVGSVEAITALSTHLEALSGWAKTAPAPWLGELEWEVQGHAFTIFDRGIEGVRLSRIQCRLGEGALSSLGQRLLEALASSMDEAPTLDDVALATRITLDGDLWVRPRYELPGFGGDELYDEAGELHTSRAPVIEALRSRFEEHDVFREPNRARPGAEELEAALASLRRGADQPAFVREALAAIEPEAPHVRRALEVARRLLDGGDAEELPRELIALLLDDRDNEGLWAVAHDWMLSQRLPRAELMLLERLPSGEDEAARSALLERHAELSPGVLPAGVTLHWHHGYVEAVELVPMRFDDLGALLRHPSLRFVRTLRLRTNHFIDAVELVGDLSSIGHPAVQVIEGMLAALEPDAARVRASFPRIRMLRAVEPR